MVDSSYIYFLVLGERFGVFFWGGGGGGKEMKIMLYEF